MRMRSRHIGVVLVFVVASCGSTDTSDSVASETSTTSSQTTSTSSVEPASAEESDRCGREMPVFAVDLDPVDRLNVDGSTGPGPGSTPAAPGQLVSHWIGEFANYELRWPPAETSDGPWSNRVAEMPATAPGLAGDRVQLTIQVDQLANRCSQLSVSVYGPRVDPLMDEIFRFADSLRPRSELASYLEVVNSEQQRADGGADQLPGECADPIVVAEVDEFGNLSEEVATELVSRFLHDRLAGRRAHDCATVAALKRYSEPSDPALCLFECDNGAKIIGPEPLALDPFGFSDGILILAAIQLAEPSGTYREQLEVQPVEQPDGTRIALITDVVAFPESYVNADQARQLVEDFLTHLANENYEAAAGLLVNEGYSQEVEEALGDVYGEDVTELLRDYCRTAICDTAYTIIGSTTPQLFGAVVEVQFDTPEGTVAAISVGSFEGQLSIGSLPPTAP